MSYNRQNHLKRIKQIQQTAYQFYEPGRQNRCWRSVWRNHIYPRYHICYNTFIKYLNTPTETVD